MLQICVALLDFFATAWRNVMKIGYARVSTGERDTAAQAQHLKRPKQEEILQLVRKGKKKNAADAARLFGVHRATVTRLLQRKLAA